MATNEPYFAAADDYEAHDALLCIAGGRIIAETDREQLTTDHRFKTRAEMAVLFADIPEALASTVEIAERCSFRPKTRKPILPRFTVGAGSNAEGAAQEESDELRRQAEEGLRKRLEIHGVSQGKSEEEYHARLDFELNVISRMNYAGYFLIVSDFIKWAKAQGIPVGPGRGSGAGSLVAWVLDHHRSRSPAVQSSVRTLPQSGTRLDAGLRHRLLPGSPRRGDLLCAAALRPRSGRADHHLRYAAGARRVARRRPCAADALWPGRQADQAGAAKSGRPCDTWQPRSRASRSCRRSATRIRSSPKPSISRSVSRA